MKHKGKTGHNQQATLLRKITRVSTLENDYDYTQERKRSPLFKYKIEDSTLYSKAGLSTQETFF